MSWYKARVPHHWAGSDPVVSGAQKRSSFLKPQSVIRRSQIYEITSSLKLPGTPGVSSPHMCSPSFTDTCRTVKTLPPRGLTRPGSAALSQFLLEKAPFHGLPTAAISTLLCFSWVMSLFALSAKVPPGFPNPRQQGCSLQRRHWVPSFRPELQCGWWRIMLVKQQCAHATRLTVVSLPDKAFSCQIDIKLKNKG